MFVIDVKNLVIMPTIVQIQRNHKIMFLCVATARRQDTPQMNVPTLRKIILPMRLEKRKMNEDPRSR